jgi:DNA (cytosine-5)-methyltransferase 1
MHNNTPIVPYVSLCSGYEGIGLGLHRCIPNLRCIAYCEREAFAISNLVAKMENGLLGAAPVFTDVTTFPWEQYAPYMAGGILSFGWPCQPVSCAGKRKATEDERWLFDIIADGIALMRPGLLFAENVEGLLSAKMPDGSLVFSHCIERLESLHYKVAAGIFSASEVGAPHQRKRVFILAHRSDSGLQGREWFRQTRTQGESSGYASECGSTMAYSTNWRGEGLHDGNAEPEDALTRCAWSSRPGEPQHAWEPPRVVGAVATKLADFCSRDSQSGGDTAQASGESVGEWREGADPNADGGSSVCGGDQGDEQAGMAHTHSCGGEEPEHQQANLSSEPSRGHAEAMGQPSSQRCEQDSALRDQQQPSGTSEECRIGDAKLHGQTQSPLGLHSDESASFLGQALTLNPYGDNVYAYENLSKKIRAREMLFSVWREAVSQEIQWTAGGLQCFLAEKILQSRMQLDSFTQRICYFVWCIQTGHEAQGWGLRGMWVYETCGHSSQGQKPIEQLQRELGYAMCQLSYEIALARGQGSVEEKSIVQGVREASERAWALSEALPEMEEVWRSSLDQAVWEKGCYVEAASIGNRTDELRLLGNGVVPATATRAFVTLMEELSQ